MSWWATGITAAIGVVKGKQNEARMDRNDKFRRAAIQYSPWTGMGDPGSQELPGAMESGISGAATGAMIGSMGAEGGLQKEGATNSIAGNMPAQPAPAAPTNAGAMQGAAAAQGPYTAMGPQGSAGALGAQAMNNDKNNPLLKYILMSKQNQG